MTEGLAERRRHRSNGSSASRYDMRAVGPCRSRVASFALTRRPRALLSQLEAAELQHFFLGEQVINPPNTRTRTHAHARARAHTSLSPHITRCGVASHAAAQAKAGIAASAYPESVTDELKGLQMQLGGISTAMGDTAAVADAMSSGP